MILGCPRGHRLQALLLQTQVHADHQPLPWPPPQDMAQHPATYPCHVPIRAALPSPRWIFLQPETTGAGNRGCDTEHCCRDLVHPLLRPLLLLPTSCPGRALALHPLALRMPCRVLCPPPGPPQLHLKSPSFALHAAPMSPWPSIALG